MKRMYIIPIGLCIVCIGLYFLFFYKSNSVDTQIEYIKKGGVVPPVNMLLKAFEADAELQSRLSADFNMQEAVEYLREKYGKTIHNKYTQVKLIEKLMSLLTAMYPDDWVVYLYAMVREIFPGMENEIFETFEKLYAYNSWLKDNHQDLIHMDSKDKRDLLWQKRYEIFGEDAEQIWASEKRVEPIYNAIDTIKNNENLPFDEKLSLYSKSIQEAFKDNKEYIPRKQQEFMDSFLAIDSVQKDLGSMSAQERTESLTKVRKAMGLDSKALMRWEELDKERDERWDAGMQYMQQRAELEKKYKGVELEKQLDSLRIKYFGDEAETIKNEEQSGYYRFSQPRKYGLE
ncbi:MAG: hypothetical protein ACUVRK_09170 [Spirochaetota bacterium]